MFFNFFLFTIIFFISFISLKVIKPLLRKYILDKPNNRSSHSIPTPKAGGIIFSLYSSIAGYLIGSYEFLYCLPIAILGFFDDLYNIKPHYRYFFQFLISGFVVNLSITQYISKESWIYYFLFLFFTFIATAYINLTNFMDGLDGLVSGCLLIILISFIFYSNLNLLPIVASLFAFLIFNWSPAKIFMGDTGSTFLGLLFFNLTFNSGDIYIFLAFALINTPLFGDSAICIVKRFIDGQNIFKPHKLHLYQRMYSAGWNKSLIAFLYMINTFILFLIYHFFGFNLLILGSSLTLILGIYINQKHAFS